MIISKAPRFILGVSIALIASGAAFAAQAQQQDSLADASRAALAQKKAQPKATKVFTDDDLEGIHGTISVVGNDQDNAAADSDDASKSAKADKQSSDSPSEAVWKGKFAAARRKLADDSKELDVLQREYNLKQTQFYSNPDVAMREQFSRKDLNDTLDEINKKKDDVAKDNQSISDLEDALRKAGGDPGWSLEPDGRSQDADAADSSDSSSERASDSASDSDKLDKADQPEKAERAAKDDADQPTERAESSKSSDDQPDRQTQAQQDNDSAPSDQPQP